MAGRHPADPPAGSRQPDSDRELEWLDEAFLPQDRLDALFHSRWGLSRLSNVLGIINYEFGGDIPRDFITSGQHTFEDLLRRLGGIDSKTIQA